MKKLNRIQKFVAWLFRIVPFDIEQALRHQLHVGIGIGLKQNKIYTLEPLPGVGVWYDEIARQQIAAYIPPEKQTDPLQSPHYIEQIRTRHVMPAVQSPLRKSRLAKLLQDAVPVPLPEAPGITAPEDDFTNDGADETVLRMKAV